MNTEHELHKSRRVKKLAAYTSAASAGAFTLGQFSHAAVVYTDLTSSPINITGGSTFTTSPIDIDGDTFADLSFLVYHYGASSTDHIEILQNSSLNVFTAELSYSGSSLYPIAAFSYGATIAAGSSHVATHSQLRITTDSPGATEKTTFSLGGYLGLQTSSGFNAWVEIQTDVSDMSQHTLTITGYAYESTGASIDAGVTTAAAPVPEPAETAVALGLLSAGAMGLARWRRRKENQS